MPMANPTNAERQVEMARSPGDVAGDERHHDTDGGAGDPVEDLHRHQRAPGRSRRRTADRGSARCRTPAAEPIAGRALSASRPIAGEIAATTSCGSTMQAAINRLAALPTRSVKALPMSGSIAALPRVNSMTQAAKINSRRSVNSGRRPLAPSARAGLATRRSSARAQARQRQQRDQRRQASAPRSGKTPRAPTRNTRRRPSARHRSRCRSRRSGRCGRTAGPASPGRRRRD